MKNSDFMFMDIINCSKKAKQRVNIERQLSRHYFNIVSAANSVRIQKELKSAVAVAVAVAVAYSNCTKT
jgi:hypothetical protein